MTTTATVSEIYSSVQGEGPYTGERQIFVRLAGCPLRCRYCDTPESLVARGHPRLSVSEVVQHITKLRRQTHANTVSVTGGEPLAQAGFLVELLPRLKKLKFRTYLETAGVHASGLKRVIGDTDVVSMDVKLPSATGRRFWKEHADFLAAGRGKVFVKIVIEENSKMDEIRRAVALLQSSRRPPTLVLQPATPIPGQVAGPSAEQVADAFAYASAHLPRVLVMGQQHKLWGVR